MAWPTPTGSLRLTGPRLVRRLHPRYHGLAPLRAALAVGRQALEHPGVLGLAPLVEAHDDVVAWHTGPCVPVATLRDPGPRALAQLAWLACGILEEAADAMGARGLPVHGGLDPWSLHLTPEGALVVTGWGLPCPEITRLRADPHATPVPGALAWCPPERRHGARDTAAGDLWSLARILRDLPPPGTALAPSLGDLLHTATAADPARRPTVGAWRAAWATVLATPVQGPDLMATAAALHATMPASRPRRASDTAPALSSRGPSR